MKGVWCGERVCGGGGGERMQTANKCTHLDVLGQIINFLHPEEMVEKILPFRSCGTIGARTARCRRGKSGLCCRLETCAATTTHEPAHVLDGAVVSCPRARGVVDFGGSVQTKHKGDMSMHSSRTTPPCFGRLISDSRYSRSSGQTVPIQAALQ